MNLLITGAWEQAKICIPQVEAMGYHVVFMQQEKDELPCASEWIEGVICNSFFMHHPIEEFPNLRFIQLTSAGFDRVPTNYISEHGIVIQNAKNVYSTPMAEHALACALWFYRGLKIFQKNQQLHIWEKRRDMRELNGKTVLIVGCGDVGKACAKVFNALGCCIIGADKKNGAAANFSKIWSISFLQDCLRKANIVIISIPLTAETAYMFGEHELECLNDDALLINLSRGNVINTEALLRHIPRLCGAALDVFEEEPLPTESPLWNFENVLITPHNSFMGDGNGKRLSSLIMDNLRNPGNTR